ncbi:DUF202 domain-containing protein [Brevibacterium sp. 5221]|uniref:DUF202 domain-containing protein n=1 Tax=Brevibacterium rongguiense TaxID=2695267 RepID=A0A6N9H8S0_9MICO|nr:DUF202 domain-containing protein [Brevibacterium rongguiense]
MRAHDDPGLQPERTSLAWGRTVVSFCAATAVLLRWMGHFGAPVLALIGLLVAAALAILASQRRRYDRHAAGVEGGRVGANVWGVAIMTGVLAAFGSSAVLLALFD